MKPWRPEKNKGEIISPLISTKEIAAAIGLTERSAQNRMQAARGITVHADPVTLRNFKVTQPQNTQ